MKKISLFLIWLLLPIQLFAQGSAKKFDNIRVLGIANILDSLYTVELKVDGVATLDDATLGGAYIYRAGGTDVPDGDVADNITITNISQVADITATASEINTPLDGALVTLAEFQQLETIGAATVSANQWAAVGSLAETLTGAEVNVLDGVTGVTAAELSYIGDVTSLIQAQIDLKSPLASPTFTGTVTVPTPFTIGAVSMTATGTELNILNGVTGVTAAELSYVGDVTSLIQAQIDLKAPLASPTFTGLVKRSVTATITAVNPGGQGDGVLTSDINEISTCGTASDAVTLPAAVAGMEIFIINNGAQILEIWPNTDDNLGAGVNTATTLAAGVNITFVSYNSTDWETK